MAWVTCGDYEDTSPFAALLPHSLLLDPERGILLLSTPRWGRPSLALGCAWSLEPRNIETVDEHVCLDMARVHESLFRSLPVGAALQAMMTIVPAHSAPAWEQLRDPFAPDARLAAVLDAQHTAISRGLPHQDGTTQGRLRQVRTTLTLRLPVAHVDPTIPSLLSALLAFPTRSGSDLATRLTAHLSSTREQLEGLRAGIDETIRAAGHGVTRMDGTTLGVALAQTLDPLSEEHPVIIPDVPLSEQVLGTEA